MNILLFMFARLSILFFYRRIFAVNKTFSRVIMAAIIIVSIYYLVNAIPVVLLVCSPLRKVWEPTVAGKCINTNAAGITGGVFNVITDLFVLVAPMPMIWQLQLPRGMKIGLTILFMFGGW